MGIVPRKKRKASPKKELAVDTPDMRAANIADTRGVESDTARAAATAASPILMGVSSDEKRQLIAEAAYFRAKRRNFTPGYELEDWLDAETEIEMMLSKVAIDNPQRSS